METFDFDPFGNALTSPAAPQPDFRFAGMFYHADSGLYLTQYRAYDPRTTRWLSQDPLGELFDEPGGASDTAESGSAAAGARGGRPRFHAASADDGRGRRRYDAA